MALGYQLAFVRGRLALCDELTDFSYEIVRNVHDRRRRPDRRFVFQHGIVFRLLFVVIEHEAHPAFVPAFR